MWIMGRFVGVLLVLSLAGVGQALAGVFTVTTTANAGAGSLRDAIAQANASAGADEIVFALSLSGQSITLTTAQLTITDDLAISGLGEDLLTVTRADGAPTFRIFEIDDGDEGDHLDVRISGLTISGGWVYTDVPDVPISGGGVLARERLLMLESTVADNVAEAANTTGSFDAALAYGGGIASSHWLTLENTTISGNVADAYTTAYNGVAIARGGGVQAEGTLHIEGSVISDNEALASDNDWGGSGSSGGGVWSETATVSNSTLSNNLAQAVGYGGGSTRGGGVYSSTSLTIDNSTLNSNTSHQDTGGNFAGRAAGGGLSADGALTMRNSTVSGNSANCSSWFVPDARGGGIDADGPTVILNSTITLNTATDGSTYSTSQAGGADLPFSRLQSTIIQGNTAEASPDMVSPGFTIVTHNLIGNPAGSSVPIGSNGNITGNPNLGPLQDNGGTTETHALGPSSLAVEAGANPVGLVADQRGFWPREINGTADIGAYELGAEELIFGDDFEHGNLGAWWRVADVQTVTLPGGVELEITRIPAGTAWIGANGAERSAAGHEYPRHRATISDDFFMGVLEVTQAQWQAIMGSNPAHDHGVGSNYPVYYVSWNDIAGPGGFLETLNAHLTATSQPGAGLYRLPTEAEWEYAARGRTTTRFSFGDALECSDYCQPCDSMGGYMWWCGNAAGTMPVGTKNPNAFGLRDVHGNVGEWVADWFGVYPVADQVDTTGPDTGTYRVVRGSGWSFNGFHARSASRKSHAPGYTSSAFGFRVARDVD